MLRSNKNHFLVKLVFVLNWSNQTFIVFENDKVSYGKQRINKLMHTTLYQHEINGNKDIMRQK